MKNIDGTSYLTEEIDQYDLMSKKHKKVYTALFFIEHLPILTSVVTGCFSISDFACLVGVPTGITSRTVG